MGMRSIDSIATAVLLGTLDTKGKEYAFLRDQIRQHSDCDMLLVDAGVLSEPQVDPDISRQELAGVAGTTIGQLAEANDRGAAVAAMADGASKVVSKLFAEGVLQGILGLGGTGGTSLVTHVMQALPVGVPKLMVSTVALGDTRAYVGAVGFYGASSMERLPAETAITENTRRLKPITMASSYNVRCSFRKLTANG